MGSGEVDIIVEKIVEATLQYAIPKHEDDTIATSDSRPPNRVCSLHPHSSCPLLPLLSRRIEIVEASDSEEVGYALERVEMIRSQYLEAFRRGNLSPKLLDTLSSGTFWPRLFLENPDFETVSRSIGRPIREWIYSILDDALGLPSVLDDESEDEVEREELPEEEEEDPDQLVDVVESDSEVDSTDDDLLAPLKGELHRIHGSNNELPSSTAGSQPPQHHRPPVVTEYLRRGTRVAEETVIVKPIQKFFESASLEVLSSSIPAVSLSFDERFTILLRALESDVPAVRSLPSEQILPVLAVRWVVRTMHLRAEETKSKEREKERWTKSEATCFLAAFNQAAYAGPEETPIPILDRSLQLCAEALQSLESVEQLVQALLLTAMPSAYHRFSGRTFHKLLALNDGSHIAQGSVSSAQIDAYQCLLDKAYREDQQKAKKAKKGGRLPPPAPKSTHISRGGGLFDMLSVAE
ncbi:hypothetical protein H0H92_009256 [Tricholoma furcatifolium]|nr:hypothetical protein H0H92_009256 [Tricholoma furcatifolium]